VPDTRPDSGPAGQPPARGDIFGREARRGLGGATTGLRGVA
jgi:hypothetical protein